MKRNKPFLIFKMVLMLSSFTGIIHVYGEPAVQWTEFSLILKPSPIGGIGVFATHDIPAGTLICTREFNVRTMKTREIPADFLKFCIHINDKECLAPERFDRMEMGWLFNHSSTPNIINHTTERKTTIVNGEKVQSIYGPFITTKDIKAGDEILYDYNRLDEPEHLKEEFYK